MGRKQGQPLFETHPTYGKVYHLGGPDDLFEMTRLENAIINMPHPRAKASTGFPDGVKETHFRAGDLRRRAGTAGAWGSMDPRSGSASTAAWVCSTR